MSIAYHFFFFSVLNISLFLSLCIQSQCGCSSCLSLSTPPQTADALVAGGGMGSTGADPSGAGESRGSGGNADDEHEVTFVLPSALLVPVHFYTGDWRASYYTAFVVVSFVGFVVTPMAFVICMFDVVRMSPTMQKVIRSLTYNIDQVSNQCIFKTRLNFKFLLWLHTEMLLPEYI